MTRRIDRRRREVHKSRDAESGRWIVSSASRRLSRHYRQATAVRAGRRANACVLQFEATRADAAPDVESLRLAASHARRACQLDPDFAEAFATLGFVLERTGPHLDALAALRRATSLEPYNSQHHLRLAFVGWGRERLLAARRVLDDVRDCAPARWLAATVHVARDELAKAEAELDAGLAELPGADRAPARFSAVGLCWLKGLLCLARGADDDAMAAFERELALEPCGHLYGREVAANTWYAKGACRLRQGDEAGALEAFEQAIARVPAHAMAHAGLGLVAADRAATGRGGVQIGAARKRGMAGADRATVASARGAGGVGVDARCVEDAGGVIMGAASCSSTCARPPLSRRYLAASNGRASARRAEEHASSSCRCVRRKLFERKVVDSRRSRRGWTLRQWGSHHGVYRELPGRPKAYGAWVHSMTRCRTDQPSGRVCNWCGDREGAFQPGRRAAIGSMCDARLAGR